MIKYNKMRCLDQYRNFVELNKLTCEINNSPSKLSFTILSLTKV